MLNWDKVKQWLNENRENLIISFSVFLVAIISFNAGRIYSTASLNQGVELINNHGEFSVSATSKDLNKEKLDLRVVASENSDKYHFLWCSGVKRIKEENKIYFSTDQEAQSKGYTLAGNCQK